MLRAGPLILVLLLASLVANVSLFVAPYDWSNDKYPPGENWSQNANRDKGNASEPSHKAVAAQIECDPNCSAKNADEHGNESNIARIIRKTSEDIVALWTWALVVATVTLAIIVLCQVRESGNTNKRQLRAYVGLEKLSFEVPNENNSAFTLDVTTPGIIHNDFMNVKIRNFGATPARDVCVFAVIVVSGPQQRLPDDFFETLSRDAAPTGEVRTTLSRFLLNPGQIEVSKHLIHPHAVRDARANQIGLTVHGRIYYRDIYGRSWRTRFCYVWEPATAHRPERFVAYEQYNGEDQVELA